MRGNPYCCKRLFRDYHYYPCSRRGIVERDGKWYCKQHDPEAEKARQVKSTDRYARQGAKIRANARVTQAERAVLEAARETLAACAHLADGNDCTLIGLKRAVGALEAAEKERDALNASTVGGQ